MSDHNKLQNMDHQELTNAGQRPEDQSLDNDSLQSGKETGSGLMNDDNGSAERSGSGQ